LTKEGSLRALDRREPVGSVGGVVRIFESDMTRKTGREALRLTRSAAHAHGYIVADGITRPYPVGRGRWRLDLAVVEDPGECEAAC